MAEQRAQPSRKLCAGGFAAPPMLRGSEINCKRFEEMISGGS